MMLGVDRNLHVVVHHARAAPTPRHRARSPCRRGLHSLKSQFVDWVHQRRHRSREPDCLRPTVPLSRELLDRALCHNTDRLGTGGESTMRWLALLLQIIVPGAIGLYLAFAMALGLPANPANPARDELLLMIIFGGAVIGFLAWLLVFIADRISLIRLVLTFVMSMLGLALSFLLIEAAILAPVLGVLALFPALAAPLAGAMAGYYLLAPALIGTATR